MKTVAVAMMLQEDGVLWAEEARTSNLDVAEETESRGRGDKVLSIRGVELEDGAVPYGRAWEAVRAIDDIGDNPFLYYLLMRMFAEGFEEGMKYREETADRPLVAYQE